MSSQDNSTNRSLKNSHQSIPASPTVNSEQTNENNQKRNSSSSQNLNTSSNRFQNNALSAQQEKSLNLMYLSPNKTKTFSSPNCRKISKKIKKQQCAGSSVIASPNSPSDLKKQIQSKIGSCTSVKTKISQQVQQNTPKNPIFDHKAKTSNPCSKSKVKSSISFPNFSSIKRNFDAVFIAPSPLVKGKTISRFSLSNDGEIEQSKDDLDKTFTNTSEKDYRLPESFEQLALSFSCIGNQSSQQGSLYSYKTYKALNQCNKQENTEESSQKKQCDLSTCSDGDDQLPSILFLKKPSSSLIESIKEACYKTILPRLIRYRRNTDFSQEAQKNMMTRINENKERTLQRKNKNVKSLQENQFQQLNNQKETQVASENQQLQMTQVQSQERGLLPPSISSQSTLDPNLKFQNNQCSTIIPENLKQPFNSPQINLFNFSPQGIKSNPTIKYGHSTFNQQLLQQQQQEYQQYQYQQHPALIQASTYHTFPSQSHQLYSQEIPNQSFTSFHQYIQLEQQPPLWSDDYSSQKYYPPQFKSQADLFEKDELVNQFIEKKSDSEDMSLKQISEYAAQSLGKIQEQDQEISNNQQLNLNENYLLNEIYLDEQNECNQYQVQNFFQVEDQINNQTQNHLEYDLEQNYSIQTPFFPQETDLQIIMEAHQMNQDSQSTNIQLRILPHANKNTSNRDELIWLTEKQ